MSVAGTPSQEQELKLYRAMIYSAHDWIILEDDEGNFLNVCGACESTSGYRAEEFMEDPNLFMNIVVPEDQDILRFHLDEVHGQHVTSDQLEFRIRRKDGAERWICHSCKPIYDEDGTYIGHLSENRDMTALVSVEKRLERERRKQSEERKKVSRELAYYQKKFQLLVESAPDAFFLHNLDSTILSCNEKACRMFGFKSKKELIGKNTVEFMLPEFTETALKGMQYVMENGHIEGWEFAMKRSDGSTFMVELSASLLKNSAGEPEGFISTMRDITLRKKQDRQLRILEQAMEHSSMALLVFDLDLKVCYTNTAFDLLYHKETENDVAKGKDITHFFGRTERTKSLTRYLNRLGHWSGRVRVGHHAKNTNFQLSAALIRDKKENPLAYLVSLVIIPPNE